jgi:tripartite-type tricarboxylate transporter receptor subunit TctC
MAWIVALLVASLLAVSPARTQDYPSKPIRILIPYAPGGVADIAARLIGAKLTEAWGQAVLVDYRPGGNGTIALSLAAKAAPDGYTLVVATGGEYTITPAIFRDMPYDAQHDLVPITTLSDTPLVLAAHGDAPYKTTAEVVAAAKEQPGRVAIGSPGSGTLNQILIEWMGLGTGAKFLHVPYKGGAPAATAVAGGEVPLGSLAISSVFPHLKTGRIRVLAVATARRSSFEPAWKTLQEEGVPDVDASNWTVLHTPKGAPPAVIAKLQAEVGRILSLPEIRERLATGGADAIPSTSAEAAARIKHEAERLKLIIDKANVRPE